MRRNRKLLAIISFIISLFAFFYFPKAAVAVDKCTEKKIDVSWHTEYGNGNGIDPRSLNLVITLSGNGLDKNKKYKIRFTDPGSSGFDCTLNNDPNSGALDNSQIYPIDGDGVKPTVVNNKLQVTINVPHDVEKEWIKESGYIAGNDGDDYFVPSDTCSLNVMTKRGRSYDEVCETENTDAVLKFDKGYIIYANIYPKKVNNICRPMILGKVNYIGKVGIEKKKDTDTDENGIFMRIIQNQILKVNQQYSENIEYFHQFKGKQSDEPEEYVSYTLTEDNSSCTVEDGDIGSQCIKQNFNSQEKLETAFENRGGNPPPGSIYDPPENANPLKFPVTITYCNDGAAPYDIDNICYCLPNDLLNVYNTGSVLPTEICSKIQGEERQLCRSCLARGGVYTALGCIPIGNVTDIIVGFLQFGAGIGGGITFILIIWGGFKYIMSQGNPEKIAEGKEIIMHAITGLLLILFSIVILKIIGVDILSIPGFGTTQ